MWDRVGLRSPGVATVTKAGNAALQYSWVVVNPAMTE
jgi:hypothetical protein